MFGGDKTKTPNPAYQATAADSTGTGASTNSRRQSLLSASLPAFSTSGLTSTARAGRRSLLGGASA